MRREDHEDQLYLLREDCKNELLEILDNFRGSKYLVVDNCLHQLFYEDVFDETSAEFADDNQVQHFVLEGSKSIFASTTKPPQATPDNIVYLTRPKFTSMKSIAGQIRQCLDLGWKSQHHVYFVPHRTIACEQILEDEGVLMHTTVGEYRMGFVPIDNDLMTLGMKDVYREMSVDGDTSSLHTVASALLRLQQLYGPIPHVRCKGLAARKIMLLLARLRSSHAHEFSFKDGIIDGGFMYSNLDVDDDEEDDDEDHLLAATANSADDRGKSIAADHSATTMSTENKGSSSGDDGLFGGRNKDGSKNDHQQTLDDKTETEAEMDAHGGSVANRKQLSRSRLHLDALFVVDRDIDLVSALVTPLTYEGLLTELLCQEYGRVEVANDNNDIVVGEQTDEKQSRGDGVRGVEKPAVKLNDSDPVYQQIRHLSIEHIGPRLQAKAIEVKLRYANFRGNKDASISEIHDFVKQMPQLTRQYKSLNMHIGLAGVLKQTSEARMFRKRWQIERAFLEGDLGASANLDLLEDFLLSYSCINGGGAAAAGTASDHQIHDIGGTVLRLLCLQSLTTGGIRAGKYDPIRRTIVQTFGYRYALTMWNLEKAGFLRRKDNLQSMLLMGTASMTSMTGGETSSSMQSVAAMATMMGSIGQQSSSSSSSSSIPSHASVQHAGSSSGSSSGSVNSSSSSSNTGPGSSTHTTANAVSVDWQVLRKQLRLLTSPSAGGAGGGGGVDDGKESSSGGGGKRGVDEEKYQSSGGDSGGMYDISYAANGFTPLIARLVQLLYGTVVMGDEKNKPAVGSTSSSSSSSSSAAVDQAHNALRLLPGPFLELNGMDQECASLEDLHESIARSSSSSSSSNSSHGGGSASLMSSTIATTTTSIAAKRKHKRKKTLVVLMVGGISVLEMAALRCLSRDPTFPYRIVMATTEVLHGNSIMRSFFPEE